MTTTLATQKPAVPNADRATKPSLVQGSPLRDKLSQLFGVDVRSLAAFRIGAAVVVLLDLWYRGQELTAYFTDAGVLPRIARIELYQFGEQFGFEHTWSLHMLSGVFWSQLVLLLVAGVFAVWLLIGYRTRLAAVATWVLLLSLNGRNPMIVDSGDVLLRCMLFWSLFLPLGACFSVDSSGPPSALPVSRRVLTIASVALLLQLCMMYWFSFGFKIQPLGEEPSPWTHDYAAVYYALHCDVFATRFGVWLRQFPALMQFLTWFSLWLEMVGPLLAFSPWLTKWLRTGVVFTFILFHAGLGLSLGIGLFAIICMVSWLVFLPSEFWDGLARRCSVFTSAQRLPAEPRTPSAMLLHRGAFGVGELLVLVLLIYTVLWNVRELDFKNREWLLPRSWNGVGRALGLDQNWSMFAPKPRTEDGWLVMKGTLHDGTEVNLWRFDEPLPWDKPQLVSDQFASQRWRKYLDNLTIDHYALQRRYFCDWLARRWNQERGGKEADRQVHTVELVHRLEITPPPGEPLPEIETEVLWTWHYE